MPADELDIQQVLKKYFLTSSGFSFFALLLKILPFQTAIKINQKVLYELWKQVLEIQKQKNPLVILVCYTRSRHSNSCWKMMIRKSVDCIKELQSWDFALLLREMIWPTVLSNLWNSKVLSHEVLLPTVNSGILIMTHWSNLYTA